MKDGLAQLMARLAQIPTPMKNGFGFSTAIPTASRKRCWILSLSMTRW